MPSTLQSSSSKLNWTQQWNLCKAIPSTCPTINSYVETCLNSLSHTAHTQAKVTGFDLTWTNKQVQECLIHVLQLDTAPDKVGSCATLTDLIKRTLVHLNKHKQLAELIFKLILNVLYTWRCCKVDTRLCFKLLRSLHVLLEHIPPGPLTNRLTLVRLVEHSLTPAEEIYESFITKSAVPCGLLAYQVCCKLYSDSRLFPYVKDFAELCKRLPTKSVVNKRLLMNVIACSCAREGKSGAAVDLVNKALKMNTTAFDLALLINLSLMYKSAEGADHTAGFRAWKAAHAEKEKKWQFNSAMVKPKQISFIFQQHVTLCEEFDCWDFGAWPAYKYHVALYAVQAGCHAEAISLCEEILSSLNTVFDSSRMPFKCTLPKPSLLQVQLLSAYCQHTAGSTLHNLTVTSSSLMTDSDLLHCVNHYQDVRKCLGQSHHVVDVEYEELFEAATQLHQCMCLRLYEIDVMFTKRSFTALKGVIMKCLTQINDITSEVSPAEEHVCSDGTTVKCMVCTKQRFEALLRSGKSKFLFNYALVSSVEADKSNMGLSSFQRNDLAVALNNSMQFDLTNLDLRWKGVLLLFKVGLKEEGIKVWCKTRNMPDQMDTDDLDCAIAMKVDELESLVEASVKSRLLKKDIAILQELYQFL